MHLHRNTHASVGPAIPHSEKRLLEDLPQINLLVVIIRPHNKSDRPHRHSSATTRNTMSTVRILPHQHPSISIFSSKWGERSGQQKMPRWYAAYMRILILVNLWHPPIHPPTTSHPNFAWAWCTIFPHHTGGFETFTHQSGVTQSGSSPKAAPTKWCICPALKGKILSLLLKTFNTQFLN